MIPAASVLALRGDPELRVLMVRRTPKSRSWAGLWVFPGGRIEAGEDVPVAAARELFEETGLLLADGSSRAMTLAQDSREAVHAGEVAFMDLVSASGLVFERARLAPVSRWQTPSFEKRRFDAHFFVSDASFLGAPCLDAVVADASETVEERWWSPADILGRYYANELELAPPTLRHLEDLVRWETVAGALNSARERQVQPIMPRIVPTDPTRILMPWDPDYSDTPGEGVDWRPSVVEPFGPSRFVLVDGRWRSSEP